MRVAAIIIPLCPRQTQGNHRMTNNDSDRAPRTQPRRHQSVIAGLAMVLGSSYSDMLLGVLRGLLVMRAIGPTARGLMRLVGLFERYLPNVHLGSLHGLSKELPIALGRNDERDATHLENVGVSIVLLLASLGSLGMLAWALLAPGLEFPTRATLALGAGIVLSGQTIALYRIVLRAWGTYSVLAIAGVVMSVSQFVLIVGGAILYGLLGAMWGWLAAMLVALLYFALGSRLQVRLQIDRATVVRLIRVGLPIAAIILADVLLRTVDGIIILKYRGLYWYGLYSVAVQVAAYLYRIPEAGGFVLMPRIWQRYSTHNNLEALRDYVVRPTLAAGLIMPVLAGVLFIVMPNMIWALIPKFHPAIYAAQVLAMSSVFLALPVAANGLLIALNQEKIVIINQLVGAIIVAVGTMLLVMIKFSLANIAMVAGLGYAVAGALTLYIVLGRYYRKRWRLWAELAVCYLPLLWALIALKAAGVTSSWLLAPEPNMWSRMVLRTVLFLVLVLPMLWYAEHRTGLLRQIRKLAATTLTKRLPPNGEPE